MFSHQSSALLLSLTLALAWQAGLPGVCADKTVPTVATKGTQANGTATAAQALALYNQKQYAAASDAFEAVIKSQTPEPRLFYYAGLANAAAKRTARANQLFSYICQYFAQAPEAAYAKTALGGNASTATVPAKSTTDAVASKSSDEDDDDDAPNKGAAATAGVRKPGAFVYTAADIAREGANGIDQSNFPNCWFEAAMSALAQLPRGQRLIASMIRYGEGNTYMVRFPGDGKEYVCSNSDLREAGLANAAKWASLLEWAQTEKFPNNRGAEGVDGNQSRLEIGMACITGRPAEIISPKNASQAELVGFIGGAVRSQNPITCATYDDRTLSNLPELVFGSHAYTIVGFDAAHNMVIIRNPHGRASHQFQHPSDPKHLEFEQVGDGVFKMSLTLFQNYFHSVARSFI